jgi:hypothetical protein
MGMDPKAFGSRGGYIDGSKEDLDLERATQEHRREQEATATRRPWWRRWLRRKDEPR